MLLVDFALFGYLPSHNRIRSLKVAKADQRAVVATATHRAAELPEAQARLEALKEQVADFEANVPPARSLGAFLHQITDIMTEQQLSDQVVAPGNEIKMNGLSCIPVRMTCKGRLKQIFEFYKQLQSLDRLVRIERVTFENDADLTGVVSMQTEAAVYYQTSEQGK